MDVPLQSPSRPLKLLCGNISIWGPQAEKWLISIATSNDCPDVVGILEHRLTYKALGDLKARLRFAGWYVVGVAVHSGAVSGGKDTNVTGGALIAYRLHLDISPLGNSALASLVGEASSSFGSGFDWTAVQIRVQGLAFVYVAVYFTDSIGFTGANLRKSHSIYLLLQQLGMPFIIMGDFNMEPHAMEDSGWPLMLGADVIAPQGVAATCTSGNLLDYGLVSRGLTNMTSPMFLDTSTPWGRHATVGVKVCSRPLTLKQRTLAKPMRKLAPIASLVEAAAWPNADRAARHCLLPDDYAIPPITGSAHADNVTQASRFQEWACEFDQWLDIVDGTSTAATATFAVLW
jgi:hypothetical protein